MPRKRVKQPDQGLHEDIFAALQRHGTHNFQPEPQERPAPAVRQEEAPDTTALLAQINSLKGQVEDMTRRSYMAPPAQPQNRQQTGVRAAEVQLNLDGLPDPTLDQAAYHRALQDRINAVVSARTQAARDEAISQRASQENESNQARNLMSGFLTANPQWAGREDLIDMVAKRVVDREAARGMDVSRYVFGDPTLFYRDVNAALVKDYGKLAATAAEDEEDEGESNETGKPEEFEDNGRTAGVLGGQESGGKPAPSRKTGMEVSNMVDDLRAMQLKSGYYGWASAIISGTIVLLAIMASTGVSHAASIGLCW